MHHAVLSVWLLAAGGPAPAVERPTLRMSLGQLGREFATLRNDVAFLSEEFADARGRACEDRTRDEPEHTPSAPHRGR